MPLLSYCSRQQRACLDDSAYIDFRFSVAFATAGPLLRLDASMTAWKKAGNAIRAIYGINQKGTSVQALEFSLALFDEAFLTFSPGILFHPKVYIFSGPTVASIFVGSNNLTVGGLETNFEACVHLRLALPAESKSFEEACVLWSCLHPDHFGSTIKLTDTLLNKLKGIGALADDKDAEEHASKAKGGPTASQIASLFPAMGFHAKPPSPLPKATMQAAAAAKKSQHASTPQLSVGSIIQTHQTEVVKPNGLVIQISPHQNGEIHLSKRAVNQNPAFFGFPFAGLTTPKKGQNEGYPQREPDPIANIAV